MKIIIISILLALTVWTAWSFYSYIVETLSYKVLEVKGDYEIRQYEPYIAMQTEVEGDFQQSINNGFRELAGYIFGGNTTSRSVAMTAPVIEQKEELSVNEKVSMTAPVMEQKNSENNKRIITFTAPKKYTLETLPKPNSDKIKFVQVSSKKYAAHRFTWYYTDERVTKKKEYLSELLTADGVKVLGEPMFAGYNGPGTIPFLMRNEILVEVE
jgi:SOUL heme-binding protein